MNLPFSVPSDLFPLEHRFYTFTFEIAPEGGNWSSVY